MDVKHSIEKETSRLREHRLANLEPKQKTHRQDFRKPTQLIVKGRNFRGKKRENLPEKQVLSVLEKRKRFSTKGQICQRQRELQDDPNGGESFNLIINVYV